MRVSNEQQNFLDNLRAPIKSFRIFALEEVIRTVDSPEVLSILEEISVYEDDPECSMLISHAIAAVKDRIQGVGKTVSAPVEDVSSFLSSWSKADDSMRMNILSNLPARLPKDMKTIGPELLPNSSPVVAARVIRFFCRNWPEEKFSLILKNLYSDSLVLKLASLRTMVHMAPELLLADMPVLLASTDPEIKALAIRGLVKIDKEEALNHLQALLLSPTQTERLAGIQNCTFLPFDMVKPLLLKYVAAETNSELLTKAGWIIEMNPDVEVPFSLFEIAERSPAKKAELVKKILNEAVKLLDKSGILGDKFLAYTKKLQVWVNKRTALRYVKQIVARIGGEKVAPEIENNLLVAIRQPIVAEAFKESLSWPLTDIVKARVSKYLGITPEDAKTKEISRSEGNTAEKHGELAQLGYLASLTAETASKKLDYILLLLNSNSSGTELKIAVFNCLTRCRLSGAEDIALKLIKNNSSNNDVKLATAAVEYMGIVNSDYVFPYLGQCLKVADMGMKSAALGILKNFDYNQAISSLRAMLYSTDKTQQRMAMECMDQFDFTLVRDMLTDFLCKNHAEEILEAGLLHFAANPSADNTYSLYKIEQAHNGKIGDQAKVLREACPAPTEEMAVASAKEEKSIEEDRKDEKAEDKAKIEEELKERLRLEKEKKRGRRPAYAYHSPTEELEVTSKLQLLAIWEMTKTFVTSKALPITAGVFILVAVAFYILFVPRGERADSMRKGSALIATLSTIEGQVIKILDNLVYLKAANDDTIILNPRQDGFKMPQIGNLLRISILPYRATKNGEKVVKIRAMRVIRAYSKEFGGEKAK